MENGRTKVSIQCGLGESMHCSCKHETIKWKLGVVARLYVPRWVMLRSKYASAQNKVGQENVTVDHCDTLLERNLDFTSGKEEQYISSGRIRTSALVLSLYCEIYFDNLPHYAALFWLDNGRDLIFDVFVLDARWSSLNRSWANCCEMKQQNQILQNTPRNVKQQQAFSILPVNAHSQSHSQSTLNHVYCPKLFLLTHLSS